MHEIISQLHGLIKEKLEAEIDANGHTINKHKPQNILGMKARYSTIIGETGATYYLRRRFHPEPVPNWALHHEDIMNAFYRRHSIKTQATVMATKCSTEWVDETLHNDA